MLVDNEFKVHEILFKNSLNSHFAKNQRMDENPDTNHNIQTNTCTLFFR